MSQRLQKHEEFMMKEKRKLFRLSFLTARKQHASTQSESESETSTKKSIRRFDKESLFDMSTESSNTTIMNSFQQEQDESSRSQESQEESRHQDESSELQEDSKSRSSSFEMTS